MVDMKTKETFECRHCGKAFQRYASQNPVFCSRLCRDEAQRQPEKWADTVCPQCKKLFRYLRSWPRKYCSSACAGRANVGNINHFEPSRYKATCEQCGTQFETTPGLTRGRF